MPSPIGVRLGEANGSARLIEEQVYVIRSLHKIMGLTAAEIARRFGVPRTTIRDVINRRTWRHI